MSSWLPSVVSGVFSLDAVLCVCWKNLVMRVELSFLVEVFAGDGVTVAVCLHLVFGRLVTVMYSVSM